MATRQQIHRRRRFWLESAAGLGMFLAVIAAYGLVDLIERAPL